MPEVPRLCWDANVFLSYINGIENRLPDIDALLDEARQKSIEIVTSSASITEVAYGAMEQGALDWTVDEAIDKLWIPPSPVQMVDFYRSIAYRAKGLVRRGMLESRKLKPMDAIHLATALQVGARELNTYDRDLLKWDPYVMELDIRHPVPASPQLPTTGRSDSSGASRPIS